MATSKELSNALKLLKDHCKETPCDRCALFLFCRVYFVSEIPVAPLKWVLPEGGVENVGR